MTMVQHRNDIWLSKGLALWSTRKHKIGFQKHNRPMGFPGPVVFF